jgi:hypothetical protein
MEENKRNQMALLLISRKIRITLSEPNSEESMRISKSMAKKTGIGYLEIHRFHNAVLNNNVANSFKPERANQISLAMIKEVIRSSGDLPNQKMRGQLSEFANDLGVSFNDVLEFIREIYTEIVNEALRPQSQA